MRIVILGSGAGGGVPQWNCGCRNCEAARAGRIPAMSQSGIAVSANGRDWALVNASPDLRQQLAATPALRPGGLRGSPIRSVLVTNGDIDHVAGLLTLREGQGFDLFATPAIHAVLAANPMLAALDPRLVARRELALEESFELAPGLVARLFAVPGKVPLYMEGEQVETDLMGEQTVGVELAAEGRRVFYIPGCASVPDWLCERISGADALLFDGTLWTDDEMVRAGLGAKTGRRMGHVPVSGPDGSLEGLRDLALGARIYVHLNNSNPLVDPASPERAMAQAAGWQIGHDGMEIAP
ncbi:pyrroloquinoline quinone biosynthesis protein PqqB [Paracoccus denitrificans]|jgi:pyrroloquinoline quinone biosynthesis protein B|uniref:Coenzyme PQQ synthesis protein B n=1 Tax=Paracoccus denitrificans (strain Pd 1222) TaxID=318586 RepID=A1B4K8_PARDP|nr:pyrroloquinoline quinone biosynthesis protein PqqB [Paracoccus denitrificans]ABL70452.1 coenzyme PQQ biosynthesis protein B [Paracoccus denitrificans PD1222]MBB4627362.1 pyrroloquinoline quinone biosynthesis protein B [Paracoccus denitrificans]MCU7427866.1 pyrroloquinoline quinone biosynthesis protein PqqB [Paracoccus denitrificans]QAR25793.1 pyrroloquinoline quinone biosynthesis protein PqqB [Paracoccus denitrificans]UPV94695.1 pyrroloquinoline quinone biosynthesis protein PqqB [Paracoccus